MRCKIFFAFLALSLSACGAPSDGGMSNDELMALSIMGFASGAASRPVPVMCFASHGVMQCH